MRVTFNHGALGEDQMKIRLAARLLSAALLCAALAACAFDERIADHAVKYNKTVEETNNSLLLLNILRAKDRSPMHFTAFSQLRGKLTLKSTGSLGLQIPFGGDAGNTFPLTPKLELSQTSSPSFDLAILDKQEFMKGILSPVEKSVLKFYLNQRWPPELLLYLFIHKVDRAKPKRSLVNAPNPYHSVDFERFQRWIEEVGDEIGFETSKTGRPIGPKLKLDETSALKQFVDAEKAGLRLVGIPEDEPIHYQLCKIEKSLVLCIGKCQKPDTVQEDCEKENKTGSTQKSAASGMDPDDADDKASFVKDGKITAQAHLRSVQGILYYLGEVLRYQTESDTKILVKCRDEEGEKIDCNEKDNVFTKTILFDLTTRKEEADTPIIGVEYNGQWYYVPKDKKVGNIKINSRTKTVLALVLQLLGLHKSSKELPTTTAVETVGGGS